MIGMESRPGVIAKILPLTDDEWHMSFLSTFPPQGPILAVHSRKVKCREALDVCPNELIKLRKIADKQMS